MAISSSELQTISLNELYKEWSVMLHPGEGGTAPPRMQQVRGHTTTSPKYFNDHKSEFDKLC